MTENVNARRGNWSALDLEIEARASAGGAPRRRLRSVELRQESCGRRISGFKEPTSEPPLVFAQRPIGAYVHFLPPNDELERAVVRRTSRALYRSQPAASDS